ncbi:hypothetical protein ACU8V3_12425 [Cobetia marina]
MAQRLPAGRRRARAGLRGSGSIVEAGTASPGLEPFDHHTLDEVAQMLLDGAQVAEIITRYQ